MLGVLPHVAEAAVNHLPPKLIRTYDRNTYATEKRAALDPCGLTILLSPSPRRTGLM